MKKSLLAVAAIGAFASAAQAQSSVTVYGLLDIGVLGSNTNTATAAANTKAQAFTATDGAESTSRLGFKGTEDLGNGTAAFFTVEMGLSPDNANGPIGPLSTTGGAAAVNRQTFVGLKKNGLGDAAIGLQYTPIQNAVSVTDPGATNNIAGNVIYDRGLTGASTTSPLGNNSSYTVRVPDAITLNTETFAGFKGHAIVVLANNNSTQTGSGTYSTFGGVNNQNGWGLGVDYTWNKLFVTANYQSFNSKFVSDTTAPTVSSTYAANSTGPWGAGGAALTGYNVTDNQQYYAATYDFGILKAYAQYIDRKVTSQITSNNYIGRSAEQIGVRSYITPVVEAWASAGLGRYNAYGASAPTANFNSWQLGSNYYLSKRTNLYAIYGQTEVSNTATSATSGYSSFNGNQYAVGVRHTF